MKKRKIEKSKIPKFENSIIAIEIRNTYSIVQFFEFSIFRKFFNFDENFSIKFFANFLLIYFRPHKFAPEIMKF